jgi:hypothetical protein
MEKPTPMQSRETIYPDPPREIPLKIKYGLRLMNSNPERMIWSAVKE